MKFPAKAVVFWCAFVVVLALTIKVHSAIILTDHPVEARENADIFTTRGLLDGHHPYEIERMPPYINARGMVYNLSVIPLAWITNSSGFAVHRAMNLIYLLLASAILSFLLFRLGLELRLAALIGLVLYADAINVHCFYTARCDSLGLLLLVLATLFIPILTHFRLSGFVVANAVTMVAWQTKPYFALASPVLWLLAFPHLKRSKWYLFVGSSVVAYGVAIGAMYSLFPMYFNCAIFANRSMGRDLGHALTVLKYHLLEHAPIMGIALSGLAFAWLSPKFGRFDKVERFSIGVLALFFAILLWLSQNTGGTEYHSTWFLPFLMFVFGLLLRRVPQGSIAIFFVFSSLWTQIFFHWPLKPVDSDALWGHVRAYAAAPGPVLHGSMTAHLAFAAKGDEVFDSGNWETILLSTWQEMNPMREVAKDLLKRTTDHFNERLRSTYYRSVMILDDNLSEPFDKKILEEKYQVVKRLQFEVGLREIKNFVIWEPKR